MTKEEKYRMTKLVKEIDFHIKATTDNQREKAYRHVLWLITEVFKLGRLEE